MVNRIDPASAMGGPRGGGQCPHVPSRLSPSPLLPFAPPPSRVTGKTSGSPLQAGRWGGGGEGVGGGGEEVTWTTAAQQLIERPLGG